MKCEYWWLDHTVGFVKGQPTPVKYCQNEDARYYTCDYHGAIVCSKCRCRCYSTMKPLTDEEISEIIHERTHQ